MSDFKVGDLIKISTEGGNDRVSRVIGFTKDSPIVPDGWIIIDGNSATNPNRCSLYAGDTSCLNLDDQ